MSDVLHTLSVLLEVVLSIRPLPGCHRGFLTLGHVVVRSSWEAKLKMLASAARGQGRAGSGIRRSRKAVTCSTT